VWTVCRTRRVDGALGGFGFVTTESFPDGREIGIRGTGIGADFGATFEALACAVPTNCVFGVVYTLPCQTLVNGEEGSPFVCACDKVHIEIQIC
jgi:hypothetical protein